MDFSNKFLIIQNALNLSQKDLALKLGLSTNAISQYITGKRKPDFNTIQKLIDLGISPLFIFSDGKDPFDENYELFVEASKYINEKNKSEFIIPMNEFIVKYRLMDKIKSKIEKIKGQTFFEKVIEEFSSSGEKIIKLLYYFIIYIQESQKKFDFPNIKKSFITELEKFELEGLDKNLSFEIKDKDKKRLIIWIENELDDSSIFEIISNIEEIKKMLKNELNFVNKIIVTFKSN